MTEGEKCVFDRILEGKASILPSTITIGNVYKIVKSGDLDEQGFEHGFLYLPEGSGIRKHAHISDVERYKLLLGKLNFNGESMTTNICDLGCCHGIDVVDTDTVIEFCKISSKFLSVGYQNNFEMLFDFFSKENYLDEYNKNKPIIK